MKNLISLILTLSTLLIITTFSVLYSEGWRIKNSLDKDESTPSIVKTGMLAVRSIPDGAKVYIDGEPITATDDTISSLSPKKYKLKVQKEGYEAWEKEINVYPELVTDITAVLVSTTPRLEPLTNTNVKNFDLSSSYNDILFITNNEEEPGIWILPLAGSPLNILRNSSRPMIPDTTLTSLSEGTNVIWSPDDKEVLVQLNERGYLLYEIPGGLSSQTTIKTLPTQYTDPTEVFTRWNETWKKDFLHPKQEEILAAQEVPAIIKENWEKTESKWSPDERKFVIEVPNATNPALSDLVVYNSEPTLPIDENRLNYVLTGVDLNNMDYSWYADSYHLILVNKVPERDNTYSVSLIRIDGTNQTTVYTGYLATPTAQSTPSGDKIIVMTTLKEGNPSNLYGIALR